MNYQRRKEILQKLKKVFVFNQQTLVGALQKDMQRPELEILISEFFPVISEIDLALKKLKRWMKIKRVSTPMGFKPGKSFIIKEPKGKVLIIGTWNYPFQLSVMPLIGAIAAGNKVVLKPSEVAPNSSKIMAKILNGLAFEIEVVEGGIPEATELLSKRFDHIFYTGGYKVAKIVMKAASEYLTPVTLELGGKSPAIVLDHVDQAAKRIVWGKFFNGGQTCVAPDYVLIRKEMKESFIEKLKKYVLEFYGENPLDSSDLVSMVGERQYGRIKELIEKSEIIFGGEYNDSQKKIAPTVVEASSAVMDDEIFGPILPILSVESEDDAIEFINKGEKPLAFYIFSSSSKLQSKILEKTSSGGVCINDTLIHLSSHALPFGGVGNSGIGNYHGKASFDLFSHHRSVMKRALWTDIPMRYPPYSDKKLSLMKIAGKLGFLS